MIKIFASKSIVFLGIPQTAIATKLFSYTQVTMMLKNGDCMIRQSYKYNFKEKGYTDLPHQWKYTVPLSQRIEIKTEK